MTLRSTLFAAGLLAAIATTGCATPARQPSQETVRMPELEDFGSRYARAWSSQDPASVAAFFAPAGSLRVNEAEPAVGRAAITEVARSFMTAFPDMIVAMDRIERRDGSAIFHWTLTGTNRGPGGTGRPVRISGSETWRFDGYGLVAESLGRFDAADYARQLAGEN